MKAPSALAIASVIVSVMVAGCAQDGTLLTGSLDASATDPQATAQATARNNPLCLTLASQIEALNRDGIPDKVAKAAAKKYKLKGTDLSKADELNKANAEFQTKCSDYPPAPTVAVAPEGADKPATKVAKAKPPVPSQKPAAAAVAQDATAGTVAQTTTTGP